MRSIVHRIGELAILEAVEQPPNGFLGIGQHVTHVSGDHIGSVIPRGCGQRLRTADARAALPASISRELALAQAANVAAMVAAFASGDLGLLGRALDDGIAEPARAPLLPGFVAAKAAALAAGAIGASISGAGPTAFALVSGADTGERVAAAMQAAYRAAGFDAEARVCEIDRVGVRITDTAASSLEI